MNLRTLPLAVTVALGLAVLLDAPYSEADESAKDAAPAETRVSIDVKGVTFREIVKQIASAGDLNVMVPEDVDEGEGDRLYSLSLQDVPARVALYMLAETAGLELHEEQHGIYRFLRSRGDEGPQAPSETQERPIVRVHDVSDLSGVLEELLPEIRRLASDGQVLVKDGGMMVVVSTPQAQATVDALLRKRRQGTETADTPRIVVRSDAHGRVRLVAKKGEDGVVRLVPEGDGELDEETEAVVLRFLGDEDGALPEGLSKIEVAREAIRRAEEARLHAERARRAAQSALEDVRAGPGDDATIDDLRREIRALREDLREIRRLLEERAAAK